MEFEEILNTGDLGELRNEIKRQKTIISTAHVPDAKEKFCCGHTKWASASVSCCDDKCSRIGIMCGGPRRFHVTCPVPPRCPTDETGKIKDAEGRIKQLQKRIQELQSENIAKKIAGSAVTQAIESFRTESEKIRQKVQNTLGTLSEKAEKLQKEKTNVESIRKETQKTKEEIQKIQQNTQEQTQKQENILDRLQGTIVPLSEQVGEVLQSAKDNDSFFRLDNPKFILAAGVVGGAVFLSRKGKKKGG